MAAKSEFDTRNGLYEPQLAKELEQYCRLLRLDPGERCFVL